MNNQIWEHYNKAAELAVAEMERMAREIMKEHPDLDHFVNAMGATFFVHKNGQILNLWDREYMKELDDFTTEFDFLGISGNPMCIYSDGKKTTEW